MKKITLDIDALAVETFAVTPAGHAADGTVLARQEGQDEVPTRGEAPTCGVRDSCNTCDILQSCVCPISAAGPSCLDPTCAYAHTCPEHCAAWTFNEGVPCQAEG